MDVCDKVTTEDSGAKDAVAAMIKRLAHRNANVQLYTLEVSDSSRNSIKCPLLIVFAACQCAQSKLWAKDAPGACLEGLHRCASSISQRPKHTPASQGENIRTDARMGGYVQGSRPRHYEGSIPQAQEPEPEPPPAFRSTE